MKGVLATIILALATQSAHAGSCAWSAKMEEDEGGSVMLACFDKPVLSYDLGAAGGHLEPASAHRSPSRPAARA